jgi:hypothetical protein
MVFHQHNKGIQGEFQPPFNQDLIALANSLNQPLPTGYHPSIFSTQFLRNDFAKFQNAYNWSPHLPSLTMSIKAIRAILGNHLFGSTKSARKAIEQIDKTKSPGYPWNAYYSTKQQVIDNHLDLLLSIIEEIRKSGKCEFTFMGTTYYHTFWQCSPKSEMRVIDKMIHPSHEKRKTRTFFAGDIIVHIVGFMLFSEQNDNLLNAHSTTWSKVGFSPFYGGFNQLAQYLLARGQNKFNYFDVSHMEASLKEILLMIIYDLRRDFLIFSEGDENCFKFVLDAIIYSIIIDVDGFLCMMFGGNPSGGFNTLMDNTIALYFTLIYTLARQSSTYEELMDKINSHHCACLGDDSVVPAHPDFDHYIEHAAELGFDVKPECPPGPLEAGKFVNSEFVKIGQTWFPKPNAEKIKANIYFYFKSRSWRLTFVKVCALRVLNWNFPKQRKEAEDIIRWIVNHRDHHMRHEYTMDSKISYESAKAAYLPKQQIEFLWSGNESGLIVNTPQLCSLVGFCSAYLINM